MSRSMVRMKECGFAPTFIIDVGANQGSWSRSALEIWPGTPIALIEPQSDFTEQLETLASDHPQCTVYAVGAAASDTTLIQTIWPDRQGSSFVPPRSEEALNEGRQIETPVRRLDSILPKETFDEGDSILIKLDIQGYELEAIEGSGHLLAKAEALIIETTLFETMQGRPIASDYVKVLADLGFELYDISGFLHRPLDGALSQVDFIFARREGILRKSNRWQKEDYPGAPAN